jgi:hypothetical protein
MGFGIMGSDPSNLKMGMAFEALNESLWPAQAIPFHEMV